MFKCENIYQEMVLEDEFHRTGFLSDKKGINDREIVERKYPQEPGIHSLQDNAGQVNAGVEAGEGEVNSRWWRELPGRHIYGTKETEVSTS